MRAEVLRRRLAVQRLAGNQAPTATDVVRLLTCVQSQEWAHGFWSLGMRTDGGTYADVQAEFDAGRFVRTHVLRPTWHYLAAEDLVWVQRLTAPRVQQLNRSQCRALGLSADDLDTAQALRAVDDWAEEALAGSGSDTGAPQLIKDAVDALLGVEL